VYLFFSRLSNVFLGGTSFSCPGMLPNVAPIFHRATLPMKNLFNPVLPLVPITIRSILFRVAYSIIDSIIDLTSNKISVFMSRYDITLLYHYCANYIVDIRISVHFSCRNKVIRSKLRSVNRKEGQDIV